MFFMALVNLQRLQSLVEPVLTQLGYELVELRPLTERGRQILRILIDREGGVSVGDCEKVSREVDTLLEVESSLRERCDLEVSSPGLDRPLVKASDFGKYAGKAAAVRTSQPIEGRSNYKGLLKGLEGESVVMVIDNQEYRIPLRWIERAHLVV